MLIYGSGLTKIVMPLSKGIYGIETLLCLFNSKKIYGIDCCQYQKWQHFGSWLCSLIRSTPELKFNFDRFICNKFSVFSCSIYKLLKKTDQQNDSNKSLKYRRKHMYIYTSSYLLFVFMLNSPTVEQTLNGLTW